MAETLQLVGSITYNTGRAGDIPLPEILSLPAISGTAIAGPVQAALASGANVITLPIATVQFVYVKNTHATATIIVSWTPLSGVSAIVGTLRPNDFVIFSASPGAASGITAFGLNASATATAEYILFG